MNGIALIDKAKGDTSFDVCHKLKKHFNTRKVGHSGTLDPNATGLLCVAINKATKTLPFIYDDKEYEAVAELGYATDTQDIDGEVVEKKDIKPFTKEQLIEVMNSFKGKITQTPPIYSAIKVNGRKLYEYARAGETVEIPTREVMVNDIELLEFNETSFKYRAAVSAGTYIRTLSMDIAAKLDNLACTTELRRTKIGPISVNDANKAEDKEIKLINPVDLIRLDKITMKDPQDVLNGKKMDLDTKQDEILLIDTDGNALAVYEKYKGSFKPKRGLF